MTVEQLGNVLSNSVLPHEQLHMTTYGVGTISFLTHATVATLIVKPHPSALHETRPA